MSEVWQVQEPGNNHSALSGMQDILPPQAAEVSKHVQAAVEPVATPQEERVRALCAHLKQKYGLYLATHLITYMGADGIDYDGDVKWSGKGLVRLPIRFRNVTGRFECSGNKLTSLKGAPVSADGGFFCGNNQLASLAGAPQHVRSFYCENNKLTALDHVPDRVRGDFDCSGNDLVSLRGAPLIVGSPGSGYGSFNCRNNRLSTLVGAPDVVWEHFFCENNQLTSLEHAPAVYGAFYCDNNYLPLDTQRPFRSGMYHAPHGEFRLGKQNPKIAHAAAEPMDPNRLLQAFARFLDKHEHSALHSKGIDYHLSAVDTDIEEGGFDIDVRIHHGKYLENIGYITVGVEGNQVTALKSAKNEHRVFKYPVPSATASGFTKLRADIARDLLPLFHDEAKYELEFVVRGAAEPQSRVSPRLFHSRLLQVFGLGVQFPVQGVTVKLSGNVVSKDSVFFVYKGPRSVMYRLVMLLGAGYKLVRTSGDDRNHVVATYEDPARWTVTDFIKVVVKAAVADFLSGHVQASAEPPTLRSRRDYQQLLQNIDFGKYTHSILGSGNNPKLWLASCETDGDGSKFFPVGFMVYMATPDGGSDDVDYIECRFGPRNILVVSSGSIRQGVPKLLNVTVEVPPLESERSVMTYLLNVIMKSGYKEKLVRWYQSKHEVQAASEPQPAADSAQLIKELDHFFAHAKPVRVGSLTLQPYLDAHAGPIYRYAIAVRVGNSTYNYRLVYLSWNNPEFSVEVVGPDGIIRKPSLYYKPGGLGKLLKDAFKIIAGDVNSTFVQAGSSYIYREFVSAFTRIEDKDILIDGVVLQAHVLHEHGDAVIKIFAAPNTEAAMPVAERRNRMWTIAAKGPSAVSIRRLAGNSSALVRVVPVADVAACVRAVLATVVVDHNHQPALAAVEPSVPLSRLEFGTRLSHLFETAKPMNIRGVELKDFRVLAGSRSAMVTCNRYSIRYDLLLFADGKYTLQRAVSSGHEIVKRYHTVGSDPVAFFKTVIKDIVVDAVEYTKTVEAAVEPEPVDEDDLATDIVKGKYRYTISKDPPLWLEAVHMHHTGGDIRIVFGVYTGSANNCVNVTTILCLLEPKTGISVSSMNHVDGHLPKVSLHLDLPGSKPLMQYLLNAILGSGYKEKVLAWFRKNHRAQAAAEPPAQDPREFFCQKLKAKYNLALEWEKITYMGRDGIDYKGNVDWELKNLTRIPIRFRSVTGYFFCFSNHLTTLAGAPAEVGGDFICSHNHLTTLAGAPGHVDGYFSCSYNHLTNLEHAPGRVGGGFRCSHNHLTTLEHAPGHVGGDFICSDNHLTTLEHAPARVGRDFFCSDNHLTTLAGAPGHVDGDFYCYHNHLPPDTKKPKGVKGKFVPGEQTPAPVHGAAEPAQPPLRFRAYVEEQPHLLNVAGYKIEVNAKAYQKILSDDRFYGTSATTMMEAVEFTAFVPVQEPGRSRRYVAETYSVDKDRCLLRMHRNGFTKISKPITGTEATVFKIALTQFIRTCRSTAAGS